MREYLHRSVREARKGPGTEDKRRYLKYTAASTTVPKDQSQMEEELIIFTMCMV
jgi:hypothetical protein